MCSTDKGRTGTERRIAGVDMGRWAFSVCVLVRGKKKAALLRYFRNSHLSKTYFLKNLI